MRRFFGIITISILLFACKPGIPDDVIQPDKMEKVLFDVHIVDGYISSLESQDTAKKVASAYYKGIYNKFGIDSALYNKSLNYYYKHPPVIKKMYDSITVQLSRLREQISMVVPESQEHEFKGVFAPEGLDSTVLDYSLNRKYNYRPLQKNAYPFSALSNSPINLRNNALPTVEQAKPYQNKMQSMPETSSQPKK